MGCQRVARRPHRALKSDSAYDVDDILPPVRDVNTNEDKLFAVPFYGESSILMYNKEVLDKAGVTLGANPTWQEVADARPRRSRPPTWPASACAASPAGATSSHR